jgi:hypothetical protein
LAQAFATSETLADSLSRYLSPDVPLQAVATVMLDQPPGPTTAVIPPVDYFVWAIGMA